MFALIWNKMFMLEADLRAVLAEIGLSQADFARLIGVTPRGVSLWMSGDRAIPGPVEAYARLLRSLTPAQRQTELARLRERKTAMRDGMYGVEYQSAAGAGVGVLVLDNGRVFGADPWGGKYDGEYTYDEDARMADLHLKVTFAPNAMSVFGISHPYEWSIDFATKLNPHVDSSRVSIMTPIGKQLHATYRYMRPLPEN